MKRRKNWTKAVTTIIDPFMGTRNTFTSGKDASSIPIATSTIERLLKPSITTKPMVAMCGIAMSTKMLRHRTETTITIIKAKTTLTITMTSIITSHNKILKRQSIILGIKLQQGVHCMDLVIYRNIKCKKQVSNK